MRARTRTTLIAIAIACLFAAGIAQAAVREYDGHVFLFPKGRTAFHLGVHLKGGRPFSIRSISTGEIPLQCDTGSRSARLRLDIPDDAVPLDRDGSFDLGVVYIGQGDQPRKRAHVHGLVQGRRAHGGIRMRTNDRDHGTCSTGGRLLWSAHPDRSTAGSRHAIPRTPQSPSSISSSAF